MSAAHEFDVTSNDSDEDVTTKRDRRIKDIAPSDTMYDALKKEMSRNAEIEPLVKAIPTRPNIAVRYDLTEFDAELFQTFVKRATNRRTKRTNARTLADLVISFCHSGTLINGHEVFQQENNVGEPLTFSSEELQQMLGAHGPKDAITKMFGGADGFVIQHFQSIVDAAGYGEEDDWSVDEDGDFEDSPTER